MLSVLLELPAEALSVVSVQSSYEFDKRIDRVVWSSEIW